MSARTRRMAPLVVAAALPFLVGCGDDSADDSAADTTAEDAAETTAAAEAPKPEWSYEGAEGPDNWGSLGDEYATCSSGTEQSPIDLTGATSEDIADISFNYGEIPLSIFNNGHTIEVEAEAGNSIELEGTEYAVKQFHFHAGSEHVIDGSQFPLEMHIVHSTEDEKLAVVGVMVEVGAENEALASVFDNIPTEVSEEGEVVDGATVDLSAALPDAQTYYQYSGSLTTPPCSEGVSWQVLETPIEVSQAQLDAFTEVVDGNFRPVQPLGERELILDAASGN
ncbi:MAG: carbonic anhydrase family protein [Microthrixaceae bacterium]